MATIVLNYDPNRYWDEFLKSYNIRHDNICNDKNKFILYYYDPFHLMKIGYEFGLYCSLKTLANESSNVQ